ncbi:MAG TPA: TolC family protein [Planctomycetota bacterium]|nr:TolC family protein [Planctomycetota bacterium]
MPVDAEAQRRGAPIRDVTLGDVLRIGKANNVRLRAAELVPEQARLDVLFAEAGFEPELYGSTGYLDSEQPTRNAFNPSFSRTVIDAELGWRQRVITGGLFDLAYRPARFETSGAATVIPEKQFTSEWEASFRQPLLRGAWTDYNLAQVTASRYGLSQAQHQFNQAVEDTLLEVVVAFWELVFARENWRVLRSALDVAEEQLRITGERIRVNQLAPRDRVADEAEVARGKEALIVAENQIRAREDDLRRLVYDATNPELWKVNFRPVAEINVVPPVAEQPFEPIVEIALANRSDVRSQRSAVAVAEVGLLEAERDTLPALDLVTGWSSDGVREDINAAFRDSLDQQYPDWSVRLEFAIPIGNHQARARSNRARLEVERQRRLLHAITLDVTKDVREAVRNMYSLGQSVVASTESVRLAESNLETEQVKLRVGASTNFEVQRRNQALREARSRLLRNQLDFRVAESRLLHAQGLLQTTVE